MRQIARCASLALAFSLIGCLAAGGALAQGMLRIGLGDDPDVLDPTLSRTYTARIVFASICDKLFDIDEKLAIVPQLALSYATSTDGKTVTIKLQLAAPFSPLQAQLTDRAGIPHRGREVRRLLEQGPGLHRHDHLPADRRCHGAPGQPALGRSRPDGPKADNPLGKDARVRRAFDLAIDREALPIRLRARRSTRRSPPSSRSRDG